MKPLTHPSLRIYLQAISELDIHSFYRAIILDPLKLGAAKIKGEDGEETTLIHECAKSGFVEGLVLLFFRAGASLDSLDGRHCTPGEVALVNNQVHILEAISSLLK